MLGKWWDLVWPQEWTRSLPPDPHSYTSSTTLSAWNPTKQYEKNGLPHTMLTDCRNTYSVCHCQHQQNIPSGASEVGTGKGGRSTYLDSIINHSSNLSLNKMFIIDLLMLKEKHFTLLCFLFFVFIPTISTYWWKVIYLFISLVISLKNKYLNSIRFKDPKQFLWYFKLFSIIEQTEVFIIVYYISIDNIQACIIIN